jgi:uncharacterized OB-fold protein
VGNLPRAPAIGGWYTLDESRPQLIGSRCRTCGTYCFPPREGSCPNPACAGSELERVPLSRTGTIWSFTNACYQPPEPYVSPDPFECFAIAAVELETERMIVLGQIAKGIGVERLRVGMRVELILETLYADTQSEKVIWKWRPAEGDSPLDAGSAQQRRADT